MSVAVIGAGWAGLAAAVALCERGVPVTVLEASRHLGGRARRVLLDGIELDNGQHVLIGAYRATLDMMRKVGANPDELMMRRPLELRYVDGFGLRAPKLPYPFNLAAALGRARGATLAARWRASIFFRRLQAARFRVAPDEAVAGWLARHGQDGSVCSHLWRPLCVSALNTPPEQASAQVFSNVLRDALTGARANSDLLIPRADLGKLFPQPAAAFIRRRGGSVECGAAVRSLSLEAGRFRIDGRAETHSAVVVATAPQHAAPLLESFESLGGLRARLEHFSYEPITTCYLQYPETFQLPVPMLGFSDGVIQWVFDRGRLSGLKGLMAVVISASGPHSLLSNEALAGKVHQQLSRTLGPLSAPRWSRVISERRATFSCRPGLERPPMKTGIPGLFLCGDYLDDAYPGTLETAVRSGLSAAAEIASTV